MPLAKRSTSDASRKLAPVRWGWLPGHPSYEPVWRLQEDLQRRRIDGEIDDTILLLEHAPVVTVGRNGSEGNLLAPEPLLRARGIELVHTDRGGDVTYHGPGQLVGYLIVDLRRLHHDVHRFLREIEEGLIRTLARWGIESGRIAGKTGVWIGEEKIASIGLRASHWVTMHGFALNVARDVSGFDVIVPCGIPGCRMTSMERILDRPVDIDEVGEAAIEELAKLWGRRPVREERDRWPS
ncbi:MAG: lipoyl(octanoyl) transferase LipB [Candidatus Eisenbacteria bacterium]|nr:lipoyl(octanoyl) transferase LipB [Candidatus Eisenbacteria bacterium]